VSFALLDFKHRVLESQMLLAHPDLRALLSDLGAESVKRGWPRPIVTCLWRSVRENKRLGGVPNSRHLTHCAGDLSLWIYTPEVLMKVLAWLNVEMEARGGRKGWGLKVHDAGTGNHIHVERRDASWRGKSDGLEPV
jgi:hypothetical protein